MEYIVPGICGIAFGIFAEKGRVHEPMMIRGQMNFQYNVMMKMFLGALFSGMAIMSILSVAPRRWKSQLSDARNAYHQCLSGKGLSSFVLGGALLGSGMTIAGACPGMVLVQVGSFTDNALYTLAGGFLGVLLYTILEPSIRELFKPSGFYQHKQLDSGGSYLSTALPLATIIACAVAGLEVYRPWTADVGISSGSFFWTAKAWPPYISGVLIGALQAPLILSVSDTLSGSGGYCTVLSQLLLTDRLRNAFPYLAKYKSGLDNWWQVMYITGAVIGSYLSAQASGSLGQGSPVTLVQALVGGGLMTFGARMAGGCTSGHGLSGCSLLLVDSFITTAAMFGGAMATYAGMMQGFI
ncbi:thiosulfate transporter TsuA-like [Watersipora subatra]|uniref:thiosulfate transporter TsuA-like n=1 Tax=Watersipora subatra TaxID=2589382 RepID=UPI00355B8079